MEKKEFIYLGLQTMVFVLTGLKMNSVAGMLLYIIWTVISVRVFMERVYNWGKNVIKMAWNKLK